LLRQGRREKPIARGKIQEGFFVVLCLKAAPTANGFFQIDGEFQEVVKWFAGPKKSLIFLFVVDIIVRF